MNERLIKSFVLIKDCKPSKKGDIIVLRKFQAQVPIPLEELYFENNNNNNHTFSFMFLIKEAKPYEYFNNLKEKYNYFN